MGGGVKCHPEGLPPVPPLGIKRSKKTDLLSNFSISRVIIRKIFLLEGKLCAQGGGGNFAHTLRAEPYNFMTLPPPSQISRDAPDANITGFPLK